MQLLHRRTILAKLLLVIFSLGLICNLFVDTTQAITLNSATAGSVYAWGFGLGIGDGTGVEKHSPTPTQLPSGVLATAIAGGENLGVAIGNDGKTYAWGRNDSGQLGNGTTTDSNTPVVVNLPAGVTATAISTSWAHVLAIGSDGKLYAWGQNNHGQLGNSTTTDSATPIVVGLPAGVTPTAISVGQYYSLALGNDGKLYAWGQNDDGQLGNGTTTQSNTPVVVSLPAGVTPTAISAGYFHGMAIGSDGKLYAWGNNYYGQVGDGTYTQSNTPVVVSLSAGVTPTAIAGGGVHSLAIGSDGKVYAWGHNGYGQLGNVSAAGSSGTPVEVSLPAGVTLTAIAAGGYHNLAISSNGNLYVWGNNGNGQLGDGTTDNQFTPIKLNLTSGTPVKALAAGGAISLAIFAPPPPVITGPVYAWGATTGSSTPVLVNLPAGVLATTIARGGDNYGVAIGSDSKTYAWGENGYGQLGNGTNTNSSTPVLVNLPAGVSSKAISIGDATTLALGSDDKLYAWGSSDEGELGNGTTTARNTPGLVNLPAGVTPTAIAMGAYHALVIGNDGNLYAWGLNNGGQLGDGTIIQRNTPVIVSLPAGVTPVTIAAGSFFSMMIGSDGKAYAWGSNWIGQLGDGTDTNRYTPVAVQLPAGVTATAIAGGQYHSLVIGSDGKIYASGHNGNGRLGDGTTTSSSTPVAVSLPAGVTPTDIAAGWTHNLAVGNDGNLYAWGANNVGQLGDGTVIDKLSPVKVNLASGTPIKAISAGNGFSYGLFTASLSLNINNVTQAEGNSGTTNFSFTVSLSAASAQSVTVDYATSDGTATAGSDYIATSGTLTFAPGTTSQTITVPVSGDTAIETDETFKVTLSNQSGAALGVAQGTGTIQNDDLPSVSINNVTQAEGNSGTTNFSFTVSLSAASSQSVTVDYATSDVTATAGSDYTATNGTLTFAPGVTTKTLNVVVSGDTAIEADETFKVTLTNPSGATLGTSQGTGTIQNDDVPSVSINNVSQVEGNSGSSNFSFTVSLSAPAVQSVTVDYATSDETATAGSDYTATNGTLTFAPGETTKTVIVVVNGDTAIEADETFKVTLSNPGGATLGTSQGTGTIQNDDLPSISINNVTQAEGNSGTTNFSFTVSLSAASGQAVTVDYATSDGTATAGSDYTAASGTLTFAPGAITKTITVSVSGDTSYEADETFKVTLSNPSGATLGTALGTGTIQNDDAAPAVSINNVSQVEGNSSTTNFSFTVSLSAASSLTTTVDYATSDGTATAGSDYTAINGTITFAPGAITKTVTVAVNGDTAIEADETFKVTLSNPNGATLGTALGTGTIQNDDVPSVSINNVTQAEGNSGTTNFSFTATLSAASFQTVTVDYATSDGTATAGSDYTAANGTLSFAPGVVTKTVTVAVSGDTAIEADETFKVTLSNPAGATLGTALGTGTIQNDDVPSVSINNVTQAEGNSGTTNFNFTVSLSAASSLTTTVDYATSDGTATAGSDYTATSGTLTFAPGAITKTVTVAVNGDTAIEVDETFKVTLTNPSGGTLGTAQGTGTIQNDDLPSVSINNVSQAEGNSGTTNFNFTATLSATSFQTVTVGYATSDGTATAGSDYTATNGTLTFAPGVITKTITVAITGDTANEGDETFKVTLTNPNGATLGTAQGTGTIQNDDAASAYAWGKNNYGQLGNGSTTNSNTPIGVTLPAGVNTTALAAGTLHSLAIGSDSKLYSWGDNDNGQLGDSTTTQRNTPVVVSLPAGVTPTAISAGQAHSLAIGSDGKLYAWGHNFYGQLGDGTTTQRNTPVVVSLPAGVTPTAIATGYYHSLATGSDGKLYAWGWNTTGQLGNGSTTNMNTPVVVSLPAGVTPTAIAAGANHSLATGSDGKLYAWGHNTYGELGNGSTTNSGTPLVVSFPAGVSAIAIAAGDGHSLASGSDGKLYAWGTNGNGQLGDGTLTQRNTPVVVSLPVGVTPMVIDTGSFHNLVIGSDGKLYAWGYNDFGQLGDGTTTQRTTPVMVSFPAGLTPTIIAGGAYHSLVAFPVVLSINNIVQLEGNSGTANLSFTVKLAGSPAQTVTVGYATSDGTATAGTDYTATNGTLTFAPGVTTQTITVPVSGDTLYEANETFKMTLSNPNGATLSTPQGIGTIQNDDNTPTVSINNVSQAEGNSGTANFNFTVSLSSASSLTTTVNYATSDGTATAGSDYANTSGTLTFAPGTTSQAISVVVGGDTTSEGDETFKVILSNPNGATLGTAQGIGTIQNDDNLSAYAWGYNNKGQLGNGSTNFSTIPAGVNMPAGVIPTALAAGQYHSLAVGSDGKLYAWGDNTYGQLGNGTTGGSSATLVVVSLPAGVTAKVIATEYNHNLAIGSDGKLYAWGYNAYGQLGNGSTTNSNTPVLVNLPAGVTPTAIATGYFQSLALGSNGKLYAWGDNTYGQLGQGTIGGSSATPVVVSLPAGVTATAIAAGSSQNLAIGNDGKLYAWGPNNYGQLGNGSTTNSGTPLVVSLPAGITPKAIAAGYTHSLAIGSDGKLYAWGYNAYGQLGNGTTTYSTTPVMVSMPAGITPVTIVAGYYHSLATGSDGKLYGWGNNGDGELGDGTLTQRTTPVLVSLPAGLTPTVVTAGSYHSLVAFSVVLSINSVARLEGNTGTANLSFTVSLAGSSAQSVTVGYATSDGTATAGSDYTATSGTITFAPGVTTQTINVPIIGDTTSETDETFKVTLSNPTGAILGSAFQGVGTIQNDDGTPVLSINNVSQNEGNSGTTNFSFTVSMLGSSSQIVKVNYATGNGTATAGSDYTATSSSLTFAPGVISQTITIPVIGDTTTEGDETFTVTLSSPTGATLGTAQGTGTILNDDILAAYSWGYNPDGELGNGSTTSSSTPGGVNLPAGVTPTAVAAGYYHSLAIGSDGKIYAWGSNSYGQLGDGTTTNRTTPVVISLPAGVTPTAIAAGYYHSLAIGSDGKVYTWGQNTYGQLGDGTTTQRNTPVVISLPAGVTPKAVAAGQYHSLAIGNDGKLYTWGQNIYGQLGNNSTTNRSTPIGVSLAAGVTPTAIAAGNSHSLALGSDGKVYTWGYNAQGQLGMGVIGKNSLMPTMINLSAGVSATAIAGGAFHSLAIGSDGKVYTWGYNAYGQLGNSSTTTSATPVGVVLPGGATPTAIGGGEAHSLATGSDGKLYAWGYNGNGQLGDGTTTDRNTPGVVNLPAGATPKFIAVGNRHNLVVPMLRTVTTGSLPIIKR